jgi:hypothetical protein
MPCPAQSRIRKSTVYSDYFLIIWRRLRVDTLWSWYKWKHRVHKKQISFCCCCSGSSFTKIYENIWWISPNCSVPLNSMDTIVKKCFCRKITVRKTNKISVFGIESVHTLLLKYILRQQCGIKKYWTSPLCFFLSGHFVSLRDSVTRWIFFWRSQHFNQYFLCTCADGFQGLSKAFNNPIQLLTFYLLLWN